MAIRERLNHVAAGIADSFISRNNDLTGYWAPGFMYLELPDSPHCTVLDLLTGASSSGAQACCQVARNFGAYLRLALSKKGLSLGALTEATLEVRFNTTGNADKWLAGDPFEVKVILRGLGREGTSRRQSRCQPFESGHFSCRYGGVIQ